MPLSSFPSSAAPTRYRLVPARFTLQTPDMHLQTGDSKVSSLHESHDNHISPSAGLLRWSPFPGRILGGLTLIVGPLLWASGLFVQWLARKSANLTPAELDDLDADAFAAPMLLVVHSRAPELSTAGWALLLLGILLLIPAMISLSHITAKRAPLIATLGVGLMILGLGARLFYLGMDATAFNLVDRLGPDAASPLFLDGYGDLAYAFWRVPVVISVGTIFGSILLAVAAYRSRSLGLVRCLLILPSGWLGMGVLKEHEPGFGGLGLALALVPCGVALLRNREPRSRVFFDDASRKRGPLRDLVSW